MCMLFPKCYHLHEFYLHDSLTSCLSGTAFFPLQSCMNHSCCPNAKAFKRDEVTFDFIIEKVEIHNSNADIYWFIKKICMFTNILLNINSTIFLEIIMMLFFWIIWCPSILPLRKRWVYWRRRWKLAAFYCCSILHYVQEEYSYVCRIDTETSCISRAWLCILFSKA